MGILSGKGEDALALRVSPGMPNLLFAELGYRILTFLAAVSEGGQVAVAGRIPRWERQDIFGCFLKAEPSGLCWSSSLGLWIWDMGAVGGTGMKGSRAGGIWEGGMTPGIRELNVIMESLGLEKFCEIMESNHSLSAAPCPQVSHPCGLGHFQG